MDGVAVVGAAVGAAGGSRVFQWVRYDHGTIHLWSPAGTADRQRRAEDIAVDVDFEDRGAQTHGGSSFSRRFGCPDDLPSR